MKEGYYVEPFDTLEQAQRYFADLVTMMPHWLLRDTRRDAVDVHGRYHVTNSSLAAHLDGMEILEVMNDGK